ncbi:hypothetical protein HY570_00305 [Candidatus Micrarchaeota archaeon]|nr:hypothetical protein [Candidatus Micrarchaeota archaeon]
MLAASLEQFELIEKPKSKELKDKKVWIDLSLNEITLLKDFGITNLDHMKLQNSNYPMYFEQPNFTGIVLFLLSLNEGKIKKERAYLYFDKSKLITVNCSEKLQSALGNFKEKAVSNPPIEKLVVYVLNEIIEQNGNILEQIEDLTEYIEEHVAKVKELKVDELFALKRTSLQINKILWHTRELLFELKVDKVHFFNANVEKLELEALYNSLLYFIDLNSTLQQILTDSLTVFHAIVSNKINATIRRLTVITIILTIVSTVSMFPNTIATIFGVPYFPLEANKAIDILGIMLLPWQIVLILLFLSSILPGAIIYLWWRNISKGRA